MLLCNLMFLPQAIPVALCGRDIIGVAKTGSGKTAAFLWPALVHIMEQPELEVGDGPIALICAPTRELCQQIFFEARRFGKVYNIHSVAVFGGGNKYEQSKALQEGAEIVVATPVSLILWCLLIRVLEQCQRITSTCWCSKHWNFIRANTGLTRDVSGAVLHLSCLTTAVIINHVMFWCTCSFWPGANQKRNAFQLF